MKVVIAAIGRMKPGPEQTLFERYYAQAMYEAKRIGLSGLDLVESPHSRAKRAQDRQMEEAQIFMKNCPDDAVKVVLDERAALWDSQKFSAFIQTQRRDGVRQLRFFIGGADGHGRDLCEKADFSLSLGPMTWPHQLVKVLLMEQIYRAITILSGHPYHRG